MQRDPIEVASAILHSYDLAYAHEGGEEHPVFRFVGDVARHLDAKAIVLYYRDPVASAFTPLFAVGEASPTAVPVDTLAGLTAFREPLETLSLATEHAERLFPNLPHLRVVLSSFYLDGVPAFLAYLSATDASEVDSYLYGIASREIFHLFRSTQMRRNLRFLEDLARIETRGRAKSELLWALCEALQRRFNAPGASILEFIGSEEGNLTFDKTFMHHTRRERDRFSADRGYAYHCATTRRAFIITDASDPAIGLGMDFDPDRLDESSSLRIEYLRAPRTIEDEASVLCFPLEREGEFLGDVKLGHFGRTRYFTFFDLHGLRTLAPAISGFLVNVTEIEELHEKIETRHMQERMQAYAETLFFYREIALGLFHQVGNKLNRVASDLLVVDSLLERSRQVPPEVQRCVDDSRQMVMAGQELIFKAAKRGQSLTPLRETCRLVEDIVRPVLKYAKTAVEGKKTEIRHTLGSEDFIVVVDAQLVKESLINIVTNAIWATDQRQITRKEILIALRRSGETAVRLEVVDSGIGIPAENLRQLFTPFFTTRPGGTGLGLYFARRLLDHFGGKVEISRSYPGKGTTVIVTLPISGGKP